MTEDKYIELDEIEENKREENLDKQNKRVIGAVKKVGSAAVTGVKKTAGVVGSGFSYLGRKMDEYKANAPELRVRKIEKIRQKKEMLHERTGLLMQQVKYSRQKAKLNKQNAFKFQQNKGYYKAASKPAVHIDSWAIDPFKSTSKKKKSNYDPFKFDPFKMR